ncbi:urease accessory protein UreD [Oculatella sp. FACHB-28]|uniref:urease accessory protein UreD n=1 Tax=Cyanophyceae TaxID=3028117 RepID=UPI00168414BD|nr:MULTISPECIES: urease accessory protein UreD [Cyanophyceae]MBD1871651.1 urease accessory protein UreD [Cyanobacteria bacterium FACHB-471]MBD2057656.1 urease accessory protein UreD [Oculatella sp. FACHB-28]MBD2070368.1 urease accessory protein UreD [Leptolyngbya sp. FACHB-671]
MVAQLIDPASVNPASVNPAIAAPDQSSQKHLSLQIGLDQFNQSFVYRQYATYPFRLSRSLRLDPTDTHRAYLYIMNSSPGLLAGDQFQISVRLGDRTSLYLTDQSATKVHQMPVAQFARLHYDVEVGTDASLEFLPEPIILYRDASLEQTMRVTLAPTGSLFLSEIIVPGRLARGECFQFQRYFNRLQVYTPAGALVFTDAMQLKGQDRCGAYGSIFAPQPILANLILVMPGVDLQSLALDLEQFAQKQAFTAASSALPNCNGLLVRAMASNVPVLKAYISHALTQIRHLSSQPALPEIPK